MKFVARLLVAGVFSGVVLRANMGQETFPLAILLTGIAIGGTLGYTFAEDKFKKKS